MPKERLPHMDLFRGFAILMVLLTHVRSTPWFYELVHNGTVFFLFIAGFFFAHLYRDDLSLVSFWSKKARRILLPYLISTLPGIIAVYISRGMSSRYLLMTVVTGVGHRNDPHWFVPMILLVFAMYPLLRVLQRNPRALVFATVAMLLVGVVSFRSAGNANPFFSLLHFGGVFLTGMLWSGHRVAIDTVMERHGGKVIAGSLLGFFPLWFLAMAHPDSNMETVLSGREFAMNYCFLGKLLLIPGILTALKKITDHGWRCAPLAYLGAASFGLFFWHGYVAELIVRNGLVPVVMGNGQAMLYVGAQLTVVVGLVLLLLLVVRKLTGAKSVMITGY